MLTSHLRYFILWAFLCACRLSAWGSGDDFSSSFLPGREYFFLRSANTQLILQADRSGTGPALVYMLFDADKPCQTLRKDRALNYTPAGSCSSSALEVLLGNSPFTALPSNTEVQWRDTGGLPAVEARWWAGGIRVTESFTALEGEGTFARTIVLSGKDLAGPDSVRLRLRLPPAVYIARGSSLVAIKGAAAMGICLPGQLQGTLDEQQGFIESAPIAVAPGADVTIETYLVVRVPLPGSSYAADCDEDRPIPPAALHPGMTASDRTGLKGDYFSNPGLTGKPFLSRVDSNLTPYWDTGSPAPGIPPDSFSVRWTGTITPPQTGLYQFSLVADDKARLFLGDSLLIDCWESSLNVQKKGALRLEAGTPYPIRVEFAELGGWAGMRLLWTLPPLPLSQSAAEAGANEIAAALGALRSPAGNTAAAATRSSWARVSRVETGDSLVQNLFDHARFALPAMVSEKGLMDAGVFEYGAQWVRDGSNVALGLIHAGHFEQARALLMHMLNDMVSPEGAAVVSGSFDEPDREEFDQMGVLLHALKAWRDWTGDTTLLAAHRAKIRALIGRPFHPAFIDSTGMVHNRREYWERTFTDGYELAYQTFLVSGLRDAAGLAPTLGIPDSARSFSARADRLLQAMLRHPSRSLVDHGALIKRRNVDGTVARLVPGPGSAAGRDDPWSTEAFHSLDPDASYALPISLHLIDPRSTLSLRTLDKLETIWSSRWDFGGYERYHSSSQMDQPGPWTFATASIARAQHDAGLHARSRRSLMWLLSVQGGNAGAWFEEIPLIRSQIPTSGIVPWTSAEVSLFTVRHWLGVSFKADTLVVRPNIFPGTGKCKADLRFRSSRLRLEINGAGRIAYALVNGRKFLPRPDGAVMIPPAFLSGDLHLQLSTRK